MLKRKWFDRREVADKILEKKFSFIKRQDDEFTGYIGYLNLNKVYKTKMMNIGGKNRCILKNGHTWLEWMEVDKNYCVIAIFDENENLIEYYIDIILEQGIDVDGIPYYDDLYLDVVVFPDNKCVIYLDEDELLEAFENKIITKEIYDKAYKVGNELIDRYENNLEKEIDYTKNMLRYFLDTNKETHNDI
ncbi:MAG: DUF402 domain-containing protein [Sarcina sp.]